MLCGIYIPPRISHSPGSGLVTGDTSLRITCHVYARVCTLGSADTSRPDDARDKFARGERHLERDRKQDAVFARSAAIVSST